MYDNAHFYTNFSTSNNSYNFRKRRKIIKNQQTQLKKNQKLFQGERCVEIKKCETQYPFVHEVGLGGVLLIKRIYRSREKKKKSVLLPIFYKK